MQFTTPSDSSVTSLPSTGFLRLSQIVGSLKSQRSKTKNGVRATPLHPPLIPVSAATWWAGVKSGRYPKPLKLSPRVTVWKVEDIRALIASASGEK